MELPRTATRLHPLLLRLTASVLIAMLLVCSRAGSLGAQDPSRPRQVMVQPGDTLAAIAIRYYGTAAAVNWIAAANGLVDPNRIISGTSLVLPPPGDTAAPSGSSVPLHTAEPGVTREITVEPGDTLEGIARRLYGSPAYAPALAAINSIPDPDRIFAGMRLRVPVEPPALTARPASLAPSPAATSARGPLWGRHICLDPGHGGVDEPGAVFEFAGDGLLREADVVLEIARALRGWLEADGAAVTMTRTTDAYLGLNERAALCNAAGAHIAVSLHLNGGDDPTWNGALALYFKAIDRDLAEALSGTLQAGLAPAAPSRPFTPYGARRFDGRMLLRTAMPATIVEPVFLSHPGEARALRAPTTQPGSRRHQIALATYRGIRLYFER